MPIKISVTISTQTPHVLVWLTNMDKHRVQIMPLFEETYGKDQALKWWMYWRLFYLACAELRNYNQGDEWIVSHYLFHKTA